MRWDCSDIDQKEDYNIVHKAREFQWALIKVYESLGIDSDADEKVQEQQEKKLNDFLKILEDCNLTMGDLGY